MRDSSTRTRRVRLARILLNDPFRVHTVEWKTAEGTLVGRSIEVLESREATVLFQILGGPSKARLELPYDAFVRINEVRV